MSNEATHKNILAVKQHSEDTRKLFRDLEARLNTVITQANRIDQLEKQVQQLQIKLYSGGATS